MLHDDGLFSFHIKYPSCTPSPQPPSFNRCPTFPLALHSRSPAGRDTATSFFDAERQPSRHASVATPLGGHENSSAPPYCRNLVSPHLWPVLCSSVMFATRYTPSLPGIPKLSGLARIIRYSCVVFFPICFILT